MAVSCHDSSVGTEQVGPDDIDFSLALWREDGRWAASALPTRLGLSMESLVAGLRQLPGEGGVWGVVGVMADSDDLADFFVVVRQAGQNSRVLLSNAGARLDWSLAVEAGALIGLADDDEDMDDFEPVGDLDLFVDVGLDADDLAIVCEDDSLYPDEQIMAIARRIGAGPAVSGVLGP